MYGSPVPGYRAPEDTVGPASRVTLVLARLVDEAARAGVLAPGRRVRGPAPAGRRRAGRLRTLVDLAFPDVSASVAVRAVAAWTQLFGMISFELFGHFQQYVTQPGTTT